MASRESCEVFSHGSDQNLCIVCGFIPRGFISRSSSRASVHWNSVLLYSCFSMPPRKKRKRDEPVEDDIGSSAAGRAPREGRSLVLLLSRRPTRATRNASRSNIGSRAIPASVLALRLVRLVSF